MRCSASFRTICSISAPDSDGAASAKGKAGSGLRVESTQVERLERDNRHASTRPLADLTSFVLPGGTPAAAALHVARTIWPPGGTRDGGTGGPARRAGQQCSTPVYIKPVYLTSYSWPSRAMNGNGAGECALGARPRTASTVFSVRGVPPGSSRGAIAI